MSKIQIVEVLSVVLNILSVYYAIKKQSVNWLIGILAIFPLLYIFYTIQLYGQFFVQIAFLAQSVYGYYEWIKFSEEKVTKILRFRPAFDFEPLLFISFACIPFGFMSMDWLDFVSFYLSMLAMWMLAKRLIENWLLFMIVDFLSVILFIEKKIYITAGLYFIFLIMAIIGYYSWNQFLKNEK